MKLGGEGGGWWQYVRKGNKKQIKELPDWESSPRSALKS